MKRFIFIICLVFLGIIGISAKKEQTPIQHLILQGDSCMNEHDSYHAITYYQQYINEHPHDLNVLRKLASAIVFVATTRSVSPAWIAFLTTVSTMKTCA